MVFVCICLMANDIEYLFMCLLAIYRVSLVRCQSVSYLFSDWIGFLFFFCRVLRILYISRYLICKYFPPACSLSSQPLHRVFCRV